MTQILIKALQTLKRNNFFFLPVLDHMPIETITDFSSEAAKVTLATRFVESCSKRLPVERVVGAWQKGSSCAPRKTNSPTLQIDWSWTLKLVQIKKAAIRSRFLLRTTNKICAPQIDYPLALMRVYCAIGGVLVETQQRFQAGHNLIKVVSIHTKWNNFCLDRNIASWASDDFVWELAENCGVKEKVVWNLEVDRCAQRSKTILCDAVEKEL